MISAGRRVHETHYDFVARFPRAKEIRAQSVPVAGQY